MPLIKLENINPDLKQAIWEITENTETLSSGLNLALEDFSEYTSIHNEIKKNEWLAAKLLLKALVESENESYEGIFKDENGKPFLQNSCFHISITHSKKYVACIMSKTRNVGIDIESIKDKIYNVRQKFLMPEELEKTGTDLEYLTIMWCCKEALYKLHGKKGIIFSRDLFVEMDNSRSFAAGYIYLPERTEKIKLKIDKLENYILVYSTY